MKQEIINVLKQIMKGTNPKVQNLFDKGNGTELTESGEIVVNTLTKIAAARYDDDMIIDGFVVSDYKFIDIPLFNILNYNHRAGYTSNHVKGGSYLFSSEANFDVDHNVSKLGRPSFVKDELEFFMNKCGRSELCSKGFDKSIKTWNAIQCFYDTDGDMYAIGTPNDEQKAFAQVVNPIAQFPAEMFGEIVSLELLNAEVYSVLAGKAKKSRDK